MEIWKDIPEYEGRYQVSNLGRVKSLNYHRQGTTRLLKPATSKGYQHVTLCKDGTTTIYRVHRLVMQVFVGECPHELQIAHLDGDSENNSLDNLCYVTAKENNGHKVEHGTSGRGESNVNARLSKNDVREIRKRLQAGEPQGHIAEAFGITQASVHYIHVKKTWAWLTDSFT